MSSTRGDIAQARLEIKEINTGITARLLNLEANAVSKVEIDAFDERLRVVENGQTQTRTWGSIALILLGILEFIIPIALAYRATH
jgi:hypothetical protein